MTLTVNGQKREVREGSSIAEFLAALGFGSERVAVERNRQVVPRAEHAAVTLKEGDELEIVHFVGGG